MNHFTEFLPSRHAPSGPEPSLEARIAARIVSQLDNAAEHCDHDISERLRHARSMAVQAAAAARRAHATSAAVTVWSTGGGTLTMGTSGASAWHKIASVLPAVVLATGLVLIQHWHSQTQIRTAAEMDAELLADDLPPAAYSDPGFVEFLKSRHD